MRQTVLGRNRQYWSLGVLCAGVGLVMATVTALYTAGPELARATGASQTQLTWITDAYTLAMAGLLLPAGALGDRYGRREVMLAGLVLFVLTAIVLQFVDDPGGLIAVRAVLGAAAAFILPSTLSIITSTFPADFRDTAVGIWTAAFTVAGGLGIVVTAALLQVFSWRSSFWIALAGGIVVLAASFTVPTSKDERPPPVDVSGATLAAVSITALVFGLIEAGLHGWGSPLIVGAVALGLVTAAAFARLQLRREEPLLDVRLFANRAFGVSAFTVVLAFAAVYGLFFLGMQYQQFVLGYGPMKAALACASMTLSVVPVSLAASRLSERFGLRVMVTGGLIGSLLAFVVLLGADAHSSYGRVLFAFLLMGTGTSLNMAPCTAAIINNVAPDKQGVAAAVNHTTREVGTALGVALIGGVLAASYSHNVEAATAHLPAPAREASRDSIAGALQVGGHKLVAAAQDAFVDGVHRTSLVLIVVLAVSAVIAALWAPPHPRPAFRLNRRRLLALATAGAFGTAVIAYGAGGERRSATYACPHASRCCTLLGDLLRAPRCLSPRGRAAAHVQGRRVGARAH